MPVLSHMNRVLRRRARPLALAAALAATIAAGPAGAAAATLSAADRADIARIEAYLNSIRSVRAGFLQVSSRGGVAEGRIYLQRPKQVRLDYKPPATLQIYADGYWLLFVDTELEEVTHVPLSRTMAGLLVRKRIRLSGDIAVQRIERGAQSIRVHIVQADEPDAGRMVLTLSDRPLELRHWTVVDPQGVETRVSLIGPEFNVRIARKIFQFDETRFENPDLQ